MKNKRSPKKKILVALFDIDGVLTDGMVYVDAAGKEMKRISFDDIDAIFALKRAGIRIGFITGEKTAFVTYVKKRFSPQYLLSGCKDKLKGFKQLAARHNIKTNIVCFVGDSEKDKELLRYVPLSFAPADTAISVRNAAKKVTKAKRGSGVIKEVAAYILAKK